MSEQLQRSIALGPAQRAILSAMLSPEGASSPLRHRCSERGYARFMGRLFAAGYHVWRPNGNANVCIQPRP